MNTRTAPAAAPQHHDAELTLSSSKKPGPDQAAAQRKKNDDLARVATEMRERSAAENQEAQAPNESAPPAPIEDVESLEVKLLDGRVIEFGPPKGISLTMRIILTFPDSANTPMLDRMCRVLMSVRSVDGQKMIPITNLLELTKAANLIGDVGIDELFLWFHKYWGQLLISDAQVLKKNLR